MWTSVQRIVSKYHNFSIETLNPISNISFVEFGSMQANLDQVVGEMYKPLSHDVIHIDVIEALKDVLHDIQGPMTSPLPESCFNGWGIDKQPNYATRCHDDTQ